MIHDAHVRAREQMLLRRCLIRQLIAWHRTRGQGWLRDWVRGWKLWPDIREDFLAQVRAGNAGLLGEWR